LSTFLAISRRVSEEVGLHKRIRRVKPFLDARKKAIRLEWAKEMGGALWSSFIFSDEVYFETGKKAGKSYTIRHAGDEYLEQHLTPSFKQAMKTVMVWGATAKGKKWPLLRLGPTEYPISEKSVGLNRFDYINRVLEARLAGYLSELRREGRQGVRSVKDWAAIHQSQLIKHREELHITPQFHSPSSPDLNPIEPYVGHCKASCLEA
jgi:hypothetical protein